MKRLDNDRSLSFIGIDIGGTFTDAVFFSKGHIAVMKTPTTVDDPSRGVLELAEKLSGTPFVLTHGSTLATNAVLERKGAKTAFIATAGFSDILSIGRQNRPHLYSLETPPHIPLVMPELCYDLPERVDFMGDVLKYANIEVLKDILADASEKGAESVAICFLFSYGNSVNEEKVAEKARELFDSVSVSSEILPEYREYERASTTALNAHVSPILRRYMGRLDQSLKKLGAEDFRIMESGGGILPASEAGRLGVRTILSGPAGGVAGAFQLAGAAGFNRIITLDMGGTSTDVSLCDGEISRTSEGSIDGFPIRVPMVDIVTMGAGGGSIAYMDRGGVLKVGPESAGAEPGPACYGKSFLPTVTDAHIVLGTISPEDFLGGRFRVEPERSFEAMRTLAGKSGMTAEETAAGIVQIALSHMQRALRIISLERGHDPSCFTLVPFGGAGPIHSPFLAEEMSIDRILIPPHPGVLSAMGMLLCDFRTDFSRTVLMDLSRFSNDVFTRIAGDLHDRARRFLKGGYFEKAFMEYILELRYRGQSYELPLSLAVPECPAGDGGPDLPVVPEIDIMGISESFGKLHFERYGFSRDSEPVELVNIRINLTGKNRMPQFAKGELFPPDPSSALAGERKIFLFDGRQLTLPRFRRDGLKPGNVISEPAVICQYDTVVLIPPGWRARVDPFENIIMEKMQ